MPDRIALIVNHIVASLHHRHNVLRPLLRVGNPFHIDRDPVFLRICQLIQKVNPFFHSIPPSRPCKEMRSRDSPCRQAAVNSNGTIFISPFPAVCPAGSTGPPKSLLSFSRCSFRSGFYLRQDTVFLFPFLSSAANTPLRHPSFPDFKELSLKI